MNTHNPLFIPPTMLARVLTWFGADARMILLGLLCGLSGNHSSAQVPCDPCPADATAYCATAGIIVVKTDGTDVSLGNVSAGEQLIIKTSLRYNAFGPGGSVGAGFYGGQARVLVFPGLSSSGIAESTNNVTPADLATTKIGPIPCGDAPIKAMNDLVYALTPADIAAGAVTFRFEYVGGKALLSMCQLEASSIVETVVFIAAPLRISIARGSNVVLTVTGPANKNCRIESASSLNEASEWTIRTNLLLGANLHQWVDNSSLPQQFYRVALLP